MKNAVLALCLVTITTFSDTHAQQTTADHIEAAQVALAQYKINQAERSFLLALRQDSSSLPALKGLFTLYHSQQRNDEALKMIDSAVQFYPSDPELWVYKGLIHSGLGQSDQADQAYHTVRTLAADNADLLQYAEDYYNRMGNTSLADQIKAQRQALEGD